MYVCMYVCMVVQPLVVFEYRLLFVQTSVPKTYMYVLYGDLKTGVHVRLEIPCTAVYFWSKKKERCKQPKPYFRVCSESYI